MQQRQKFEAIGETSMSEPITGPVPNISDLAENESSPIRISVKPTARPNVLASDSVELGTELGLIRINDARILKNRAGALWFALPTYSVTSGKLYEYFPTVEIPSGLLRRVSDAALEEFERWQEKQREFGGAR
jgi:hypothetical protein